MTIPSFDGAGVEASTPVPGLLSGTSNFQPEVAALSGGGFAVVWKGFATFAADADRGSTVFARLFDADRAPLGDAFAVPQSIVGDQGDFLVTETPDGGFAVAFFDSGEVGVAATATTLSRFDAGGARVGDDLTIESTTGFLPGNIGLAAFGDGKLALVQANFTSGRIELATINADQTLAEAPTGRLDGTSSVGGANVATSLDNGDIGFIASIRSRVGVRFVDKVEAHRVDADGNVDTLTLLDESRGNYEAQFLPDGRIVLHDYERSSDFLTTTGTVKVLNAAGEEISSAVYTKPSDSSAGYVADPSGGFYRMFNTNDVSSDPFQEAMAQRFDAQGEPEGEPFVLHRDSAGFQARPQMAVLSDGDLVAAVESSSFSAAQTKILVQAFDPDGDTAGAAPTDIALAADPVVPGKPGGIIGRLSTTDGDVGDTHSYEVLFGAPFFEIDGDQLRFAERFTPEDNATFNQVTIRVTDSQFNTFDEVIQIPFEGGDTGGEGGESTGGGGGTGGGSAIAPMIWRGDGRGNIKNGAAGDDVLNGRGGKDRLDGKGGDDKLVGGGGNDRLKGGGGADEIVGGRGRDVLTGGGGRDDFVFGRRDGRDRITDFQVNRDDLEITSGAKRFKKLEISQKGEDLHIEFGRTKVVLEDVDRSDFDKGDVAFV